MVSDAEDENGEGGRLSTEGDDGLDSSSISRLKKLLICPDLNSDGLSPFVSCLCATGDLGDVDAMAARRGVISGVSCPVGKRRCCDCLAGCLFLRLGVGCFK